MKEAHLIPPLMEGGHLNVPLQTETLKTAWIVLEKFGNSTTQPSKKGQRESTIWQPEI
jgi:hypothetical protein